MQLPIGPRMRLVSGRQQIGGNIAFSSYKSHNFDFGLDVGKFCKKLRNCIAFQNILHDFISRSISRFQPI